MTDPAAFPDVEVSLRPVLMDLVDGGEHIGVDTPAELEQQLPFLQVTCLGGSDNTITDTSRVDVNAFAATRAAARDLAEAVRQRLIGQPHVGDGFVLDRCRTDQKPRYQPWTDNPPPYRYTASYTVTARRSA